MHARLIVAFFDCVCWIPGVERPESQKDWAFDGVSVLPILRGETPPTRGIGWIFDTAELDVTKGYGYRYGQWKYRSPSSASIRTNFFGMNETCWIDWDLPYVLEDADECKPHAHKER